MAVVQHPSFPNQVQEVPDQSAKDWTDQGWVRVKKDDEQKVLETARRAALS